MQSEFLSLTRTLRPSSSTKDYREVYSVSPRPSNLFNGNESESIVHKLNKEAVGMQRGSEGIYAVAEES